MNSRLLSSLAAAFAHLALLALPNAALGQGGMPPRPRPKMPSLQELAGRAQSEGLKGTMHGANQRLGTYVFTWWTPGDFFQSMNFSLVPSSPAVDASLGALQRHQEVTVKGRLIHSPDAQPHIRVETVEPGKKWDPGVAAEPPSLPKDLRPGLRGKKRLKAMVHAVAADGTMLAVEIGGEIVPVQVPADPTLRKGVAGLYRGDRIDFRFQIAKWPERPLHLALVPEGERPLKVVDGIHDQHDKTKTVEGRLVLFPHSPVLRRAIWGVEEKGPDGLHRYFTIFNFQDRADQEKIDTLLQDAWKSGPGKVKDGRNKYIHPRVRVRVAGTVSNPAANQANPTLVTTAAQVTLSKQN
jgi:hypothetical protein